MSQGFHPERDPSDLKNVKTVEENGEEAEPVRNGAESISEGEGIDANSGSTDSSGEGVTFQIKSGKFIPVFLCLFFVLLFTLLQLREMLPPSKKILDGRKMLITV